jgi:hypothetical protein
VGGYAQLLLNVYHPYTMCADPAAAEAPGQGDRDPEAHGMYITTPPACCAAQVAPRTGYWYLLLSAACCVITTMQIDTGKIDEAVAAMLGNHVSMNVDNLYSALMAKTPK